jgi:drug/metabolite transporter (DMT)-like permease
LRYADLNCNPIMTRRQVLADLALLALAAAWGGTFVMVKNAVVHMPVFTFLALRFLIATITLVLMSNPRRLFHLNRRTVLLNFLAGALFAAGYGFQTIGLQTTGPGQVGFITGLSVVIVPIGSAMIWRIQPNRSAIMGVACAVIGLALLTGAINGQPIAPGAFWVMLGTLGFASQILVVSVLPRQIDPRSMATLQVFSTAVGCGLIAVLTEKPIVPVDFNVWGAILFTGIVVSAIGVVVQTWAQAITSATHTALIFASEPVFAATAGFILIGERLGLDQTIGCGLILLGMLISELGPVWQKRTLTLPL